MTAKKHAFFNVVVTKLKSFAFKIHKVKLELRKPVWKRDFSINETFCHYRMNIWLPFLCIYLEYDPLIIKNVLLSIIGFFHVSVWGSIPPMKLCMHIKGVGTIDYSTFFPIIY